MKKTLQRFIGATTFIAAIITAGCSGGTSPRTSQTVSGIAATGQAIVGQVHLKDSAAAPQELTGPTGADGSYTFNVAGLTPPFLVKVDWVSATGPTSLVSFASGPGTANITPISNLIITAAAGGTDPVALYNSPPTARQGLAGAMAGATATVMAQLKPLMDQYGVTIDPITGPFAANHTGLDAMLDAVRVSMNSGTVTISNNASGAVIFSGPAANMAGGVFNRNNMPAAAPGQGQSSLDGAALYASNCAGCHGSLSASNKQGASVATIQTAINSRIGGMGSLSSLTSQEIQAIAAALAPATNPGPTPPPSTTVDGTALYGSKCAGCHGAMATSTKKGITLVRLQSAITNNVSGMGTLSTLTAAELQAIVDALASATPPPAPTPTPADGAALYGANCAGCHGALATSAKAGAAATAIQTAITSNTGGMGYLTTLSSTDISAIATALAAVTPPPTPTPACGSCHAIPPATGHHSMHRSRSCSTCHGTGYSSTTVNAATHNNGVKNVVTTIGWNPTLRTCANSCHGTEAW